MQRFPPGFGAGPKFLHAGDRCYKIMVKSKSEINCCLVLFSQSLLLLMSPNREGEGAHSGLTVGHLILKVFFPRSFCHLPQSCARGVDEEKCCVKCSSLLACCRKTAGGLVSYRQARRWYFQAFIYLFLGTLGLLNALSHISSPIDWLSVHVQSCPSLLFKAPNVFTFYTMLQCKIWLLLISYLFYFSSFSNPIFKFTSRGSGM